MTAIQDSQFLVTASKKRESESRKFCLEFKLPYCCYKDLPEPGNHPCYVLYFSDQRTELLAWSYQGHGPVFVDFESHSVNHRRSAATVNNELLAKAVGLGNGVSALAIVDATAGMGHDSMMLASLGCLVTLYERNPIIHALLADGFRRARQSDNSGLLATLAKLRLHFGEADFDGDSDVVYLDPMFPSKTKKNLSGKEMTAFSHVLNEADDGAQTLHKALQSRAKRVVVKRPRLAADLGDITPSHRIVGKSSRFDVYARKTLKTKWSPPALI